MDPSSDEVRIVTRDGSAFAISQFLLIQVKGTLISRVEKKSKSHYLICNVPPFNPGSPIGKDESFVWENLFATFTIHFEPMPGQDPICV